MAEYVRIKDKDNVNGLVVNSSGEMLVAGTFSSTPFGSSTATTTLSAVTTGTGTAVDFTTAANDITMAVIVSGTVTAGAIALDVSQDNTNWVMTDSTTLTTNTNIKLTASGEAWRYARGRITTNITGGATATATLMKWG